MDEYDDMAGGNCGARDFTAEWMGNLGTESAPSGSAQHQASEADMRGGNRAT